MNWSQKVQELMDEKNINQKELSEKSGITRASICRYLKGDRKPRIDVIVNIAKALSVDVESLLDEEDKVLSPYESIELAIARNGNKLTKEEQQKLADMIFNKED